MSMNICFILKFDNKCGEPNIDPFCQTTTKETYYILGIEENISNFISKQEQFNRYEEVMYKRFKDTELIAPLQSHLYMLKRWLEEPEFAFDIM